jgi:hypothetical protein
MQHGAPAVGDELHCAVRDHRGGDRHRQRQRPHQHEPAGHAEHAGYGRGHQNDDEKCEGREPSHARLHGFMLENGAAGSAPKPQKRPSRRVQFNRGCLLYKL